MTHLILYYDLIGNTYIHIHRFLVSEQIKLHTMYVWCILPSDGFVGEGGKVRVPTVQ